MSDLNRDNQEEIENIDIKEKAKDPIIRLNTKPIPIIVVLFGAALGCVISIIQFVDFSTFFFRLVQSVVVFGIIGCTIKIVLDFIFNKKADKFEEESKEEEESDTEPDDSDDEELTEEEEADAVETEET